jgi:hypothetical protein
MEVHALCESANYISCICHNGYDCKQYELKKKKKSWDRRDTGPDFDNK